MSCSFKMKSWRWPFITITVLYVSLIPIEIVGNWNADDYYSYQRKRREDEWNDWLFKRPGEPDEAESENAVKKEESNPSPDNSNVQQPPQNNQQSPQIQPFGHNQNPNPGAQQNPHPQMQPHPQQNQHQQMPNQNFRPGNNFQGSPNQVFQPNPHQNPNQQQQAQIYQQQQQQQQQMHQMNLQRPPNGVYSNQPHPQRPPHNNFQFQNQGHNYPPPPFIPQQFQGQGQIPVYPPNQQYQPYQPLPPQIPGQPLPLIPQGNNPYQQGQMPYNPQQHQPGQQPLNPAVLNPHQEIPTTTTTTSTTTTKTTTKNLYFAGPDYVKQQNQNPGPAEPNSWLFEIPPPAPEPEPEPHRGIPPNQPIPDPAPVPVPVNPQQGPGQVQGQGQMPLYPPNNNLNQHHHPNHPHVYPVPLIHPPEQQGQNPVNPQPGQPPFRPEPETTKKTTTTTTTTKNLYFAGPEYVKERNPNEEQGINPYLVDEIAYKYNNNNNYNQNQQPLVVRAGNEEDDGIRAGGHLPNKYQDQNLPEEWEQNQNPNQNNFYEVEKGPVEIDSYGSYLSNRAQNHAHIHRVDGNINTNINEKEKDHRSSWKDRFMNLINSKSKPKSDLESDSSAVSLLLNKKSLWMLSCHFLWFTMMRFNI